MVHRNRSRRQLVALTSTGINFIHKTNPWIIAWWSASLPGLGQLMLGHHIKGLLLIIWEIGLNVTSGLNTAIMYSCTGQIDKAIHALDKRYFFLYAPVFVYAVWDSYRTSVTINNMYAIGNVENARIKPYAISIYSLNFLDKRQPWLAGAWSLLSPGLGHLFIHRLIVGFYLLIWWIVICLKSHVLESLYLTLIGQFALAVQKCDPGWLLFVPSLYCFAFYEAFVMTFKVNKLFDRELSQYLKEEFQDTCFPFSEIMQERR